MAQVTAEQFVLAVRKMAKRVEAKEIEDTPQNPVAEVLAKELNLKNASAVHSRIKSYTAKGVKGLPTFAQKPRGRSLNVDALNAIGEEMATEENGKAA
jgi:hypothetical protein